MTLFSELTPAETMLIIDSDTASLKNLMKHTLMDLVLKKIITIKDELKKAHPRDRNVRKYTYILAGQNLSAYKPKKHELSFLGPFLKRSNYKILFPSYIKLVYQSVNRDSLYKKLIRSNPTSLPYFKTNVFYNILGWSKLSPKGYKTKADMLSFLKPIDQNLDHIFNHQPEKALEILLQIGGNIFLLKNFKFGLLNKIDQELIKHQKTISKGIDTSFDNSWAYIEFFEYDSLFDGYFDSFESTFDAYDSSCSSHDSGCSSCSGCGGCGGCS